MNFAAIVSNIEEALEAGEYDQAIIKNWRQAYKDAQEFTGQENPEVLFDGYVDNLFSLGNYLRSAIGITDETEDSVIVSAIEYTLNKEELAKPTKDVVEIDGITYLYEQRPTTQEDNAGGIYDRWLLFDGRGNKVGKMVQWDCGTYCSTIYNERKVWFDQTKVNFKKN